MTPAQILPFLALWLLVFSAAAVFLTVFDKKRAQKHGRRVPERTLLWLAALGGSAAMYLTMRTIRHKTRHKKFMAGLPLVIVLQLLAGLLAVQVLH